MIHRNSPDTIVQRLPNMSDRDPATEKLIDEAMDQPPTIQEMLAVSPSSIPIGTRMPVTRTKPQEMGQTYENDKDFHGELELIYRRRQGVLTYDDRQQCSPGQFFCVCRVVLQGRTVRVIKI